MILAQTELAEQTVIHVAQEFAWLLLGAVLIGILADPGGSICSARGPLRRMVLLVEKLVDVSRGHPGGSAAAANHRVRFVRQFPGPHLDVASDRGGQVMARDAIRIVPMPEDQLEAAAAVMARAFFDEPLFVAGHPDPTERARVVPWIARWTFRFGLEFGTVLVSEDLAGVAIAYRTIEPVFTEERVAATEGELREQLGSAAWDRYERMMHIWEAADAHLIQAVPEPHWYLDMVAVEPTRQGTGVGSALLQAVQALAELEGWPIALLTFRARNVPFYKRHGYEMVAGGTEPMAGLAYWGFRRASLSQQD